MKCKKHILIVSDISYNNEALHNLLHNSYEIIYASNAKEGLELLRRYDERIGAVIIELFMPMMNAYDFLSIQQNDEDLKSIPVIVTTKKYSQDDEIKAISKGAVYFVNRPYSCLIKNKIDTIIKLRENAVCLRNKECDSLTGLYTKDVFFEKVSSFLKREDNFNNYNIICINIENFKVVNDTLGECEGNNLLISFAHFLNGIVKEMDGISSRFCSDIFTVFVPSINKKENIIFENLQRYLKSYCDYLDLNIKAGIYNLSSGEELSVRAMCDRAKFASQTIKGMYQKHFVYYDDDFRTKLLSEQEITSSMERAIIEEQFKIFFQPKCFLETEEVIGAEALIRWEHAKKGFLFPSEFIPLFEKNGFITTLDLYVLEKSCQLIRKWIDCDYKVVPISINISRIDIYDKTLPQKIKQVVEKYDIPPEYLHFEITESAYTENTNQLIEIVRLLKSKGFVVEMDDFGSGYSSLNILNKVPFDTLKLDLRFLQSVEQGDKSEEILNFILSLAKRLKLSVIAEGIETKDDSNFLKKIGCMYGQGYYFARPMSLENFENIIKIKDCKKTFN